MSDHLDESALEYHRHTSAGKISVVPTKSKTNQHDLALAYSPGVAVPCMAIAANPGKARNLTSRGNLVAVITNGTAVLGLGNIGALASKPVMEGKACLSDIVETHTVAAIIQDSKPAAPDEVIGSAIHSGRSRWIDVADGRGASG